MIHTKNAGINAAIDEVKTMSLSERIRARYEARLKERRDQQAREDYVREQGIEQGIKQGIQALIEICEECGLSESEIIEKLKSKFNLSKEDAEKYLERK